LVARIAALRAPGIVVWAGGPCRVGPVPDSAGRAEPWSRRVGIAACESGQTPSDPRTCDEATTPDVAATAPDDATAIGTAVDMVKGGIALMTAWCRITDSNNAMATSSIRSPLIGTT